MTARIINMFPRAVCNPGAESFQEWYAAYPRKAARADAEKAYIQTMLRGHLPATILLGAVCYAEFHRRLGTEKQYLLLPASFLRGERFLDEELLDCVPPSQEEIDAARDKADRLMKRGKYAQPFQK